MPRVTNFSRSSNHRYDTENNGQYNKSEEQRCLVYCFHGELFFIFLLEQIPDFPEETFFLGRIGIFFCILFLYFFQFLVGQSFQQIYVFLECRYFQILLYIHGWNREGQTGPIGVSVTLQAFLNEQAEDGKSHVGSLA